MKSRNTFLFGAGAAVCWGGPTTTHLTMLIRNSGFFMKDNKTRITEYIYNELLQHGYESWEANFETIINVVEELIIYHSSFNTERQTPSLFKAFTELKNAENILNFSVNGARKHGFTLEIPVGKPYEDSERSLYNETPEQMFFQQLLRELITTINAAIIDYSYHTDGHSVIIADKNEALNASFGSFIKRLSKSSAVRMYNLNYDRVFKVIMERNGIPTFDGFDYGETLSYESGGIAPNLLRIVDDLDSLCHYNLHGSGHWKVEREDHTQLPNPRIFMSPFMDLAINDASAVMQIERGRNIVVSSLITGYQKAQKSTIAPFKQMQSTFDRDCLKTDKLFIIGYSFGDEHVNATIRTAMLYNKTLKIIIVDPAYSEVTDKKNYDKLKKLFIKHFTTWLDYSRDRKKIKENHDSYFGGRVEVYSIGFKDFLIEMSDQAKFNALTT